MHPIIDEIRRVNSGETIRSDVFRRWQHGLVHEVQPLLDERDALILEREALATQEQPVSVKARKGVA